MTYSIVARDPVTGELGVAIQSRWFAAAAGVPWAEPGVGAVATQSFALVAHGVHGLERLRAGEDPAAILPALMAGDPGEATRQVGIVDALGRAAAHTGTACVPFAGHRTAPDVSVQANMMERPTVPDAMLAAFAATSGDLGERLFAALVAAEAEGGDVRGRQAAGILVVPGLPADPWARRIDIRVDDHPAPLDELARVLRVARAYEAFERADEPAEAGDHAGALELIARAHELAPEDDQITLWLAVALARTGRAAEARAAYVEALAAEPRAELHLRRFAEAGHLPDADRILPALLRED